MHVADVEMLQWQQHMHSQNVRIQAHLHVFSLASIVRNASVRYCYFLSPNFLCAA